MDRATEQERRGRVAELVASYAFVAWLCAAVSGLALVRLWATSWLDYYRERGVDELPGATRLVLELGQALQGRGLLLVGLLLLLSSLPYAARPRLQATRVGYLSGAVLACLATAASWLALRLPLLGP